MTFSLEEIAFQTRVLAQGHPMTGRAQAYLNETVARERTDQPVPEIGIWAGYAMTNGYCLRRVEEADTHTPVPDGPPQDVTTEQLDEMSTEVADRIRQEEAADLLLYPEPLVIEALDYLIGGEVERRLSHWAESIDEESFEELESYLAWWTLKGYALRIAEHLSLTTPG